MHTQMSVLKLFKLHFTHHCVNTANAPRARARAHMNQSHFYHFFRSFPLSYSTNHFLASHHMLRHVFDRYIF